MKAHTFLGVCTTSIIGFAMADPRAAPAVTQMAKKSAISDLTAKSQITTAPYLHPNLLKRQAADNVCGYASGISSESSLMLC